MSHDDGDSFQANDALVKRAIERLQAGHPDAKNDLLVYAQRQLVRMAQAMLYRETEFETVRRWEQTDDVVQGSLMRMSTTIDKVPIASPRDFFKLAATNIRWELKTLREKHLAKKRQATRHETDYRPGPDGNLTDGGGRLDSLEARLDPFAELSRFLDEIETIPEHDREIFDLILVNGLTLEEAADAIDVSLATFKRHYRDARVRLGSMLQDQDRE